MSNVTGHVVREGLNAEELTVLFPGGPIKSEDPKGRTTFPKFQIFWSYAANPW